MKTSPFSNLFPSNLYLVTLMLLITFQHADCRQVTSDLIDLVRSCVMDPAFPALVEQVECALKKLTTDEPSIQQIWEQKPQKIPGSLRERLKSLSLLD